MTSEAAGDVEVRIPGDGPAWLTFDAIRTLLEWTGGDEALSATRTLLATAVGGSSVLLPADELPTLQEAIEQQAVVLGVNRHTDEVRPLIVLLQSLRERAS